MRAAIIGTGNVGKTIFHDLQRVPMIDEITLIGRDQDKVRAEVLDARDAAVVRDEYGPRLYFGGYQAVEGADLIIFTAGASNLKTEDRTELVHANAEIAEEVFSEVDRYNRDAIILNVTNPLDSIVMQICKVTGREPRKVIGSGTLLESARLVRFIAELFELSDRSIHMTVVGEHGNSAVALLSSVRIMGMTMQEYLEHVTGSELQMDPQRLETAIRTAGFRIFRGKGYTSTGVSATICRIAAAIAANSHEVFPVSSVLQGEYGVKDVAISVPSVIGRNGIEDIWEIPMTEEEGKAFQHSAEVIRQTAISAGIF